VLGLVGNGNYLDGEHYSEVDDFHYFGVGMVVEPDCRHDVVHKMMLTLQIPSKRITARLYPVVLDLELPFRVAWDSVG